jgi:hypothetical protein
MAAEYFENLLFPLIRGTEGRGAGKGIIMGEPMGQIYDLSDAHRSIGTVFFQRFSRREITRISVRGPARPLARG